MYLDITYAGIKITINQYWVDQVIGTRRYRIDYDDGLCHIAPYLKRLTVFVPIPLYAQSLHLLILAYACILYVWIHVDINMTVYRNVFTLPYSSVSVCGHYDLLPSWSCQSSNIGSLWCNIGMHKLSLIGDWYHLIIIKTEEKPETTIKIIFFLWRINGLMR